MLKRFFIGFSILLSLSFTNCGGESTKNGKELLYKILQFIGIPHSIIVNVCQDRNRDGICEVKELFTKVTINKGDNINDVLRKISLTLDGKYFLETYNPEFPILVELQDSAKVNFDDGKFTLSFNGFKTKENNETKEISILESMVDVNALTKEVADKFRTLDNAEAQEKYYTALFESLEININTLRRENFNKEEAINATIKEMADETKSNQEQANRINGCENNQTCVNREIKKLVNELIITDDEVVEIRGGKNNSSTSVPITTSNVEEVIYGKWVKPSRSVCDSSGGTYNEYGGNECGATWENAKNICSVSGTALPNIETLGAVVTDCGGDLVSSYNDNLNNYKARWDKNVANEAYQSCYKEKGFISGNYWSSTVDKLDVSYAWHILLDFGYDVRDSKRITLYVRCIRRGE